MAYLKSIATGVFEEQGIVSWSFIIAWPFYPESAGAADDLCQPVHLGCALGPKCDPASIALMHGRFGDPEEFRRAARLDSFELQPAFDLGTTRESQGGQQGLVEWPCLGQTVYAQINVIVSPSHRGFLWAPSQSRQAAALGYAQCITLMEFM